jgi:hypothetical protein
MHDIAEAIHKLEKNTSRVASRIASRIANPSVLLHHYLLYTFYITNLRHTNYSAIFHSIV